MEPRRVRTRYAHAAALACLLAALSVSGAFAQPATAVVGGTVTDESGAVLPDVEVTILNTATRLQRSVTTSRDGHYTIAALPPGRYVLMAQRQGFALAEVPDVVVNVNDALVLNLQLKIAAIGETVSVTAQPARISTSPAVATVVDRQFVSNLPLNGRSFQSLIALTPGVVFTASGVTNMGQFSVNGQRTNANYFTVDGVSANAGANANPNLAIAHGQEAAGSVPAWNAVGGTQGLISVDALEEFKIQTSTYSAEFGRQPGAQVTLVSRSGTNDYRGSAFASFRDDALDATDWFTKANRLPKARLHQSQFGGVLGGPVRLPGYDGRNRTFFFLSYEGLDVEEPRTVSTDVPGPTIRRLAHPSVKPLLDIWPVATEPENPVTFLARFNGAYSDVKTAHASSIRIDQNLGMSNRIFGRFNYAPSTTTSRFLSGWSEGRPLLVTTTVGATQVLGQSATHDIRFNHTLNDGQGDTQLDDFGGAIPLTHARLLPAGLPSPAASLYQFVIFQSALATTEGRFYRQEQFNLVDTVTWMLGPHSLKFGVDYRELRPVYQGADYFQSLQFTTADSMIGGRMTGGFLRSQQRLDLTFRNFAAYVHDTWTLTPRVTLDLGLRWDVNPAPSPRGGKTLYTVSGIDRLETMQLASAGTRLYPTHYDAFGPRFGTAIVTSQRPGWEQTLRGGIGIYYDLGAGSVGRASEYFPYTLTRSLPVGSVYPLDAVTGAPPPPLSLTPPLLAQTVIAFPDHQLPLTYQWSASVEQMMGRVQMLSVTYLGAAGRRLLQRESIRDPNPSFSGGSVIDITRSRGESSYHALQLQYVRRLSKGLQALASYTLSKSEDTVSGDDVSLPRTDFLDPKVDRGPSDFDTRHVLTGGVTYSPPGPGAGVLAAVFGGWSFDTIVRVQSAPPVNVTVTRNLGFGNFSARPDLVSGVPLYIDDPNAPGNRRFNPAAFTVSPEIRQGSTPRNYLRGFPLHQVDFSVRRDVRITARTQAQVRVDLFNVLNTPNFAAPSGSLGSAPTGVLVPSSTFGLSTSMLYGRLGGLNRTFQVGGPRSVQLSARLSF